MNIIILFLTIIAWITLSITTLTVLALEMKNLGFGAPLFHPKTNVKLAWVISLVWIIGTFCV